MDKQSWNIIGGLIVCIIVFLITKKIDQDKIKKNLSDCSYSVGNIDAFFYRTPVGNNIHFSSITYSYIVNSVRYSNNYDELYYKLPSSPNVNDKFVVAYNKKNPQKSILLGDYPIKTQDDFDVFMKKYKNVKIKF